MNLSAILVVGPPGGLEPVLERLEALDGVDVHHADPPSGRVIVTQEAPDVRAEVDGLKRIKALPGVALAEMVYHRFEGDREMFEAIPEDLDPAPGAACVPPYLYK